MNKDYIFIQKKTHAHFFPYIYLIGKIYSFTQGKYFHGKNFGRTLVVNEDGVMNWYASVKGISEVGKKVHEMLDKDLLLVKKMRKKFEMRAPEILAISKKIKSFNLSKLSNIEIWKLVSEYLKLYENVYVLSEPVVLALNDYLSEYLRNYLMTICPDRKKVSQVYNVLVSPIEKSFVKKEEEEFLNLALKVSQGKIKNVKKAIKNHTLKYGWIPFDYGVYLWDEEYFSKILNRIIEEGNISEKIQLSKKYSRDLPFSQEHYVKSLNIDTKHQKLFGAMRDGAYLLDYKKEVFTQTHVIFREVLEEISRRLSTPRVLIQYCRPEEIKNGLLKNRFLSLNKLEQRYKLSLTGWSKDKIQFIEGKEGLMFLQKYLKQDGVKLTKIDGVIASAGRYIGPVKILKSSSEINRVVKGDIIVTAMTSPEYVPAMRLAGAVITDEGGIMCHAAIVSRELGIPCVIGTKIATKLLKEGEIVEVNANHNSVKILKI